MCVLVVWVGQGTAEWGWGGEVNGLEKKCLNNSIDLREGKLTLTAKHEQQN